MWLIRPHSDEAGLDATALTQIVNCRFMSLYPMKIFIPLLGLVFVGALLVWADWPMEPLALDQSIDRVVIEKSVRKLTLFYHDIVVKQYPVALGRNAVGAKEREGDRKTPEGVYRIIEHKRPSGFHLALRISYPEERDQAKARALGVPPGSDIMIHGIKNGLGWIGRMHRKLDWTAGCIAVTNSEIEEIGRLVSDGTVVEIRP